MRCFVTGATGLVGSHLLIDLLEKKHEVCALYRSEEKKDATKKIFLHYNKENLFTHINWIKGDVLDILSLIEACKNIQHVYHCAAIVSFNKKRRNELYKINIEGTANVVDACIQNKIEKLCFVSSITALGTSKTEINEETSWQNKTTPTAYSTSKYYSENEIWRGVAEGLKAVIVNPGVIIGPGNWNEGSAALFRKVWEGLKYYTESTTGFVDVRDVAVCMEKLMNSSIENKKYILVSENISFKKVLSNIAIALEKPLPSIKANKFLIEIAWRLEWIKTFFTGKEPVITKESVRIATDNDVYSNKKIIETFNYNFISIEESIRNTASAFLKANNNY
jgi:nucleoside-diphosphate-sugar epimerase